MRYFLSFGLFCFGVFVQHSGSAIDQKQRPNFVIFLADDLGIGDIGCFGNTTIKTPNIDALCRLGVKMEHNLAPESLCTPSRGAFLTGRYAVRAGLGSEEGAVRVFLHNSANGGLPVNETTFASVLRNNGYHTSLIGKWHLGLSCNTRDDYCHHPLNHGFHHFYGIPLSNMRDCQANNYVTILNTRTARYREKSMCVLTLSSAAFILLLIFKSVVRYQSLLIVGSLLGIMISTNWILWQWFYKIDSCMIMRDYTVVEQPVFHSDLTQRFVSEAVNFIDYQNQETPFLLMLSFAKVHTALFTTDQFRNHSVHGKYGDNVEEMDWAVGAVVAALQRNNYLNNTLIFFTSDHGPHLEEFSEDGDYEGGSKGYFKGGKGTSWEGGIRVPTVAMWQGILPPGRVITEPTSSLDVFTTFVRLAGAEIPQDRIVDGKDIFDLLSGKVNKTPHDFIFHYCGNSLQAVTYVSRLDTTKVWKLHLKTPIFTAGIEGCLGDGGCCKCHGNYIKNEDPPLLFYVTEDPKESIALGPSSGDYHDIVSQIKQAIEEHTKTVDIVSNQLRDNSMQIRKIHCCNFPWCSCSEKFPYSMVPINK